MHAAIRIAVLAALGVLAPATAHACSRGTFWMARPPLYFLASALPDTVQAGPGPVEFHLERGESGPARTIFGQVVRIEELGRNAPPALTEALRAHGPEVVLVRWGYGADCRTTQWGGSARWIETAETELFTARLRDPGDWVGGRPTLDVNAYHTPYPHARVTDMEYDGEEMMTARELFALMHLLPTFEEGMESADPYPFVAPLFRWARANPALARRFPATEVLESAYEASQPCVAPEGPSPAAGTYRVTLEVEGEPPRTLFIRTSADRHGPECPDSVVRRDPGRLSPRRAASHMLHARAALHPDSIPGENGEGWERGCSGTYRWNVWEDDSEVWAAELDIGFQGCFPDSAGLRQAEQDWMAMLRRDEEVELEMGVIRRLPEGGMAIEGAWRLNGRTYWRFRGERISPAVLP